MNIKYQAVQISKNIVDKVVEDSAKMIYTKYLNSKVPSSVLVNNQEIITPILKLHTKNNTSLEKSLKDLQPVRLRKDNCANRSIFYEKKKENKLLSNRILMRQNTSIKQKHILSEDYRIDQLVKTEPDLKRNRSSRYEINKFVVPIPQFNQEVQDDQIRWQDLQRIRLAENKKINEEYTLRMHNKSEQQERKYQQFIKQRRELKLRRTKYTFDYEGRLMLLENSQRSSNEPRLKHKITYLKQRQNIQSYLKKMRSKLVPVNILTELQKDNQQKQNQSQNYEFNNYNDRQNIHKLNTQRMSVGVRLIDQYTGKSLENQISLTKREQVKHKRFKSFAISRYNKRPDENSVSKTVISDENKILKEQQIESTNKSSLSVHRQLKKSDNQKIFAQESLLEILIE